MEDYKKENNYRGRFLYGKLKYDGTLRRAKNMRNQCYDLKSTGSTSDANEVQSEYFNKGSQPQKDASVKNFRRKRKLGPEGSTDSEIQSPTCEPNKTVMLSAGNHYKFDFYNIPCVDLSKKLLGKILVRHLPDGTILRGRIVETEAYLGAEDKASHSYQEKMTERNKPMFMNPGTSYVYLTYGMYHCFNISSKGVGAAVLLRALEPLEGQESMSKRRLSQRKPSQRQSVPDFKNHELCNGPAKLTISFDINKANCNKLDLVEGGALYVEPGDDVPNDRIVVTSRIGIQSAGIEWASKPLRFYELGNKSVSKRDKKAEALLIVSANHE